MDGLGLAVVGLVALEWLGLGWLSGIGWPDGGQAYASWALRLLVGLGLTSVAMLLLALIGVGFASPVVVLVVAALGALGIRTLLGQPLPLRRNGPNARGAPAGADRDAAREQRGCQDAPGEQRGSRDASGEQRGDRAVPGEERGCRDVPSEQGGCGDVPREQRGCGDVPRGQRDCRGAQAIQTCEPSNTKTLESCEPSNTETPGSSEPSNTETPGSSEPSNTKTPGSSEPSNTKKRELCEPTNAPESREPTHTNKRELRERSGPKTREQLGWLLLACLLVAAGLRSFSVPEAGWDAYSHWGLKALAYAQSGTIVETHTVHEYYPPLVPLAEAFVYLQRGRASIDLGKDVWALVGSALILCLVAHLRRLLTRPWLAAYVGVGVLLASTQLLEDFSTGQADLALTAFLTLATLAALAWLHAGQRDWFVQAGVFAAAAALTKFEGLPRIGVLAACVGLEALLLRRPSTWWAVGWLVLGGLAGMAVWLAFELSHGIAATGEHVGALQPQAIIGIVGALVGVFGGLRTGGAIAVVVLAWLVAARRSLHRPNRLLATTVIAQAAATLVAFLVSDTAPEVEVRTAATRLVEQFMPLALVASAVWLEAELIIRPGR